MKELDDTKQAQIEQMWKEHTENQLIATYVPNADCLTRAEALALAQERDIEAARQLAEDAIDTQPRLEEATLNTRINKILQELGF